MTFLKFICLWGDAISLNEDLKGEMWEVTSPHCVEW